MDHAGQHVIKTGAANMQRGIEAVGGKLTLTDQQLTFESHRLNVQTGTSVIPLSEVVAVEPVWTKVFNLVPITPNSLAVTTRDGAEHSFVLNSRKTWRDEIARAAAL